MQTANVEIVNRHSILLQYSPVSFVVWGIASMGCIGEGVSLPQGYMKNRKTTKKYNIQKFKPIQACRK